jgi:formylmethanofuran dehydrogenase subunit A
MSELLIRNACVVDPLQGIEGEILDLAIRDGRIVESVGESAEVIDAQGYLTMAGGIDSHTHICGTKVNFGRYMSPEDMRAGRTQKRGRVHATSGYSVPTTYGNSYRYTHMGYTAVLEGAMAPLEARHTHEEFRATPLQDTMANVLFDGNWAVMEAIRDRDTKRAAAIVAWVLSAVKGFAIKLTNPGGTEAWGWGKNVECIRDPVPYFDVTPAEIIETLVRANELLQLPHSVHLHCNNLGKPGNYACTIGSFDMAPDLNPRRQSLYVTHVQFHSYGGTTWKDLHSKADVVAYAINARPHVVTDMGQMMFGKTTTMTADGPMEFNLYRLHHNKWSNHDVELETASGIIPVYYSRTSVVNCVMWAIGLELALQVKNPWQCLLSTDNPNGGPFVKYPEIIALLMSRTYRDAEIARLHPETEPKIHLPSLDREMTWPEIAVMTRAGQAKALGLAALGRGHLAPGATADVAVYPLRIGEIDPSREYEKVIEAFRTTRYTVKGGTVVARDGEILLNRHKATIWVKPKVSANHQIEHDEDFVRNFERYYTVRMSNYPVSETYLPNGACVETEAQM